MVQNVVNAVVLPRLNSNFHLISHFLKLCLLIEPLLTFFDSPFTPFALLLFVLFYLFFFFFTCGVCVLYLLDPIIALFFAYCPVFLAPYVYLGKLILFSIMCAINNVQNAGHKQTCYCCLYFYVHVPYFRLSF